MMDYCTISIPHSFHWKTYYAIISKFMRSKTSALCVRVCVLMSTSIMTCGISPFPLAGCVLRSVGARVNYRARAVLWYKDWLEIEQFSERNSLSLASLCLSLDGSRLLIRSRHLSIAFRAQAFSWEKMSSSPSLNKSPPMPTVPAPEHEERPERMRDWICRMVDSGRFHGLEWINPEKTIFRVPWIHAKKRGYCKERDAALFREWALHSGKYRDESDPTVWKINFRCAINGLKDIMEIKDLQTEDCRVYKVLPSRRTRRKPRRRFPNVEPYGPIMTPQSE